MSLTLYDIETGLAALIETEEGGIPPELEAKFRADLARQLAAAAEKRDRVADFIRHLEAQADFAAREATRLKDRRDHFLRAAERMREYVQAILEQTGQKRLEGRTSTFSLRQNPPMVAVLDEAAVPAGYKVVVTETRLDKRAIAEALKVGVEVPGCELRRTTGLSLW
jgi:hypothetical protein